MRRKKRIDPLPEEFVNYDEAAEFWDTHDTTDYPDAFSTVKVVSEFRSRHYEIPIAPDVVKALQVRARKQGVTLGHLASDLLRRRLRSSG